jgi:subtilisin family serine protease/chitodextrinase
MSLLHDRAIKKNGWYAQWHKKSYADALHWIIFGVVVVLATLFLTTAVSQSSAQSNETAAKTPVTQGRTKGYVPNRVLVKFKTDNASDIAAVKKRHNLTEDKEISDIGVKVMSIPADQGPTSVFGKVLDALRLYPKQTPDRVAKDIVRKESKFIEFAEPDALVEPSLIPNDVWYTNWQHQLPQINAPAGWDMTTGSPDVIIAILDTGVRPTHEDLAAKLVPGRNIYGNNDNTADVYGHGTLVAGTAAAITNNVTGVSGVSWQSRIMPVRIGADNGYATYSDMASGLTWAADHGAGVANISYRASESSTVSSAAKYFVGKTGGVVTSSAGNESTFVSQSDNPNIMTVGAIDPNNALYSWSNSGNIIDVVAPGCDYSTSNGGDSNYSSACGTSFSSPITAGLAALVKSANPNLTGVQIMDVINHSADDLGAAGWDTTFGWGRINVARAIQAATNSSGDLTPPSVPTGLSASTATDKIVLSWTASTDNIGVTGYKVYRNGVEVGGTSGTTSYTDATALAGVTYSYTVRAFDIAGNTSADSAPVTATLSDTSAPTVPGSLSATSSSSTQVNLSWASSTDNVAVTGYAVYRGGVLLKKVTTTNTTDTSVTTGQTYTYTVKAYDAAGNYSASSVPATVTVPDTIAPSVPTNFSASGISSSGFTVTWGASTDNVGVTGYKVFRNGSAYKSVATNALAETGLAAGTQYTYTVQAYDAASNYSVASVAVVVTTANADGTGGGVSIGDTIAPTIAITSPSSGTKVKGGTLNVSFSTTDNVGVTKVELYVDGSLAATSTANPFSISLGVSKLSRGTHILTAKAYDAAGNSAASASVSIIK